MKWLLARLKEGSTWRGIILLLTVCGMKLEPDQQEAIIAAGLAIVGLIGVLTKDEPKIPPIELQSRSEADQDDGYINRNALREQWHPIRKSDPPSLRDVNTGLRITVPPDPIAGTEYDERSGFENK